MKLAFSTNAYTRFSLPEAVRGIARAGFSGVEILADVPHAYPGDFSSAAADALCAELRGLRVSVSNVNINCSFGYWKDAPPEAYFEPSIISPDARRREDRIELIRKGMILAKRIGARNVSITSGRMLAGMPPKLAEKQFAESIGRVLAFADELDLDVGIECEPGLFIEYVAELREWIDRLGHPRLGANLDIGHCAVIGESIPEAIELLAGRIWNLHVEDIPGRKHYHLIPGEGTIDWAGVKKAMEKIRYDRFLTVELYTHTADPQIAAEKSFAFLRQLLE
jgi:fructoselysine 3-epimerase